MAAWIEIRCEDSGPGGYGDRCWSDDNVGPMQMSSDDNASIMQTVADLRKEAKASGWKRTKAGWICPFCAKRGG